MEHEHNVLCDVHCKHYVSGRNTFTKQEETNTKVPRPHQIIGRGPSRILLVCTFSTVLMGAVLLVWTIGRNANGRFRLQLLCLFPGWVATEQIFP